MCLNCDLSHGLCTACDIDGNSMPHCVVPDNVKKKKTNDICLYPPYRFCCTPSWYIHSHICLYCAELEPKWLEPKWLRINIFIYMHIYMIHIYIYHYVYIHIHVIIPCSEGYSRSQLTAYAHLLEMHYGWEGAHFQKKTPWKPQHLVTMSHKLLYFQ